MLPHLAFFLAPCVYFRLRLRAIFSSWLRLRTGIHAVFFRNGPGFASCRRHDFGHQYYFVKSVRVVNESDPDQISDPKNGGFDSCSSKKIDFAASSWKCNAAWVIILTH